MSSSSRERVIPVRIERGPSPAFAAQPPPQPPLQPPQPPAVACVTEPSPTVVQQTPAQLQGAAEVPNFRRISTTSSFNGEIGDKIVGMLDEIERRVENLRETASLMEQEKESLIEILKNVQLNKDLLHISHGEKEDIEVTTNRLLTRCRTVAVCVSTVRNAVQENALKNVNSQIDELLSKMKEDVDASKEACKKFLNACNPEQPDGPIDQKFQAMVIECTADDQKKVRKRLEDLIKVIDRTDKTISQAN